MQPQWRDTEDRWNCTTLTSLKGESYNVPFSVDELQSALFKCHDSSPCFDYIHYAFLRNLPEESRLFLITLHNHIWRTCDFPLSWEVAIDISIRKF